jgi:DNA-directed RNA polymerase specialized sigma subunit
MKTPTPLTDEICSNVDWVFNIQNHARDLERKLSAQIKIDYTQENSFYIKNINNRYFRAFIMRFCSDMTYTEISKELGISYSRCREIAQKGKRILDYTIRKEINSKK